jgi:hypothetical protein
MLFSFFWTGSAGHLLGWSKSRRDGDGHSWQHVDDFAFTAIQWP